MEKKIEKLKALLATKRAGFASLLYTSKSSGEVARHTLILGSNYIRQVERSLLDLSIRLPEFSGIDLLAANELIQSFENTIENFAIGQSNSAYTKADVYDPVFDPQGEKIQGIKVHKTDGSLELSGLSHRKIVIVPGMFKTVKSAPKTIAKAILRKSLPVGRWKTFAIESFHEVKMIGDFLVFDEKEDCQNSPEFESTETAKQIAISVLESAPFEVPIQTL